MGRSLVQKCYKINWFQFVRLNFFAKTVKRKKGAYLIPYRGAQIKINPTARLNLSAILRFNFSPLSGGNSYLFLDAGSKLDIKGDFNVYYNCDIAVYKNAVMSLGGGYMNAGSQLRCSKEITIGKGATIARDVIVADSDSHRICKAGHVVDQPIVIEDHVWLGIRSLVLKGCRIGEGAIVAAGSVVTNDVNSKNIVAGVPAKSIQENVEWEK